MTNREIGWIFTALALVLALLVYGGLQLDAQPQGPAKAVWTVKTCDSLYCVTDILNSLEDRAVDAKVTSDPFLPAVYVWYRK